MPKKLSIKDFIEKAKKTHNKNYGFDKTIYVNNHTPIIITCPLHGDFKTIPMSFLRGCDCPDCAVEKTKNKTKKKHEEKFFKKIEKYNTKNYGVTKIIYKNTQTPIILTCNLHGDFSVIPHNLRKEIICPECKKELERKKLGENFFKKCQKKFKYRFDYSESMYINNTTPIKIYDKIKKEFFFQTPSSHYKSITGNPNEKNDNLRKKNQMGKEEFVRRAKEIHGNKYDYSKVVYINNRTFVKIICPIHGEFLQKPSDHLEGAGCHKCWREGQSIRQSMGKEEFVKRAKAIHGEKYDYSKVQYKNNMTKICINCPEHGDFLQYPVLHLKGYGCKKCNSISILEKEILNFLEKNKIKYEYQKRFEWLKYKKPLSLDFFLPDYKIAIECQGEQHYKPQPFFGGDKKFIETQKRDKIKEEICNEHGIKIIYYTKFNSNKENVFKDIKYILNQINTK